MKKRDEGMVRQIDIQENTTGIAALNAGSSRSAVEDLHVAYSGADASSFYSDFKIKSGLLVSITKRMAPEGFRGVHDVENAPISLGYNLGHAVQCTFRHGGKGNETFRRPPGSFVLSYMPKTRCLIETPPGERLLGVSIHFSPRAFRALFQEVPSYLQGLFLKRENASHLYHQARMTPETAFVVNQLVHCPYSGEIQRLFLESKALELAALMLCEMAGGEPEQTSLSQRESEQVRQAYQMLFDRMDAPPGLCELSREVGLNRNKLNRGFKRLYGGTVFTVLRDIRLRMSWDMLLNSEMDLVEIALSVGYSNQGNFATAFRRRYGVTPLSVRKAGMALCDFQEREGVPGAALSRR